jgi:hypothetical protein
VEVVREEIEGGGAAVQVLTLLGYNFVGGD